MRAIDEPNIMGHYYSDASVTYRLIDEMRYLMKKGFEKGFTSDLVAKMQKILNNEERLREARAETIDVPRKNESPSFMFGKPLSERVVGKDSNLALFVEGFFTDHENRKYHAFLPKIFETKGDPHAIYTKLADGIDKITVDELLTNAEARRVLLEHKESLKDYKRFTITSSKFFYIPGNLDSYFLTSSSEIDVAKIAPFLVCSPTVLINREIQPLSKEEYMEQFFDFFSYRLKDPSEVAKKILKKLNQDHTKTDDPNQGPIKEENKVCDFSAYMIVRKSRELITQDEVYLMRKPILPFRDSEFRIKEVILKDYFEKPKQPTNFKAYVNHVDFLYKMRHYWVEVQGRIAEDFLPDELERKCDYATARTVYSDHKSRVVGNDQHHKSIIALGKEILDIIYGKSEKQKKAERIELQELLSF